MPDNQAPDPLFRLDGQVAIVTGGSEWLGFDIASAFAQAGCHVAITSRTPSRADEACRRITEASEIDALPVELDQRDHRSVKSMAQAAFDWKGRIDILVNNAGGGSGSSEGNLFRRSPEDIADLIAVNLTGAIFCCQEVGRFMLDQRRGKIINIASIAALTGRDRRMYERNRKMEQPVDYAAAKAGVLGLTRDLAGLLSPHGICVNAISPGGFDKGDIPAGFVSDYAGVTPLLRMGRMGRDLKGAALFLASAASDYVTGHNLVVDGGFTLWK